MNESRISAKGIVIVFSLCAVSDFVWSYIRNPSIPLGLGSVLFGLFGTAFYVLVFSLGSRKDKSNGGDSTR
jgi:hypothetical protein